MNWLKFLVIGASCAFTVGCQPTLKPAPFSFQAVKGERPEDIIIYVTNSSNQELTGCSFTSGGADAPPMQFSPLMKPGQVATTGVFGAVNEARYRCDSFAEVAFMIPSILGEPIDTSNFDMAQLPDFNL